jgi:hypothetical protein
VNVYSTNLDLSPAGIPFRNEVYEGDSAVWADALKTPAKYVDWIIAAPHDLVSQHIDTQSPAFRREYIMMAQDALTGTTLWRRNGLPPLPNRPLSVDAIAPYVACNQAKGTSVASVNNSAVAFAERTPIALANQSPRNTPAPQSRAKSENVQ